MGNYQSHILRNDEVEIDLKIIFDICGENMEDMEKLITTFLKSIPSNIEKLEKYLERNDPTGIYNTAHLAKSSLSIFRVNALLENLILIERNAKENNFSALEKLIPIARKMYIETQNLLQLTFHIAISPQ